MGPDRNTLHFALSRRDLYEIVRIIGARRSFRKIAMPALAVFVFLGHAMDGNYGKGVLWAAGVVILYWGISQFMYLIHVYGTSNETLLVPQEILLKEDGMVVTSEHGQEIFDRPSVKDVDASQSRVVIRMDGNFLVFLKKSFNDPEDFLILKNWLKAGPPGNEETQDRENGE